MGELLPTVAARTVREGLLEYLDTTFALAEPQARLALTEFLEDPDSGIFKGPYVRLRLPFRPADDGWRDAVGWHPTDEGLGFEPYGHQAQATARLSSLEIPGRDAGPHPTLITTGTGSGKTEAFLYPILDHVRRANADGVSGLKALILYPMNALAHDQAQRIASLISSNPSLAGVTAGIYTGTEGPKRTTVSSSGLISDRSVMRSSPPDILLTNYKMLDQLLLRRADAPLWAQSAESLRYLVLDEFHTYDGAQGTDVAMLLRRLGLTLRAYGAAGQDPIAGLTPVATSATLGDQGDPAAMLRFAETVFGVPFPPESVVTESRLTLDDWLGEPPAGSAPTPLEGTLLAQSVSRAVEQLGPDPEPAAFAAAVAFALYAERAEGADLGELARQHPLTAALLDAGSEAVGIADLAEQLFPSTEPALAQRCLESVVGLLSHLRRAHGTSWPSVETHLWVRELTRINRDAATTPAFSWGDDGGQAGADDDETSSPSASFPAVYCRLCGRSGWSVLLSPANESDLDTNDEHIRREHIRGSSKVRTLIADEEETTEPLVGDEPSAALSEPRWFNPAERRILKTAPSGEAARDGSALRVVMHVGPEAGDRSKHDTCPACHGQDGIRFLGSSVATQLSVGISTLFGAPHLDAADKKTLVFTDSVQDAAHRAGFIQARSRSLTVRSMLREAVGSAPTGLDELADRVIELAGDDADRRYRVLPPELAEHENFAPFWQAPSLSEVPRKVRNRVRTRIEFDATLEFGLQSRLGRTLEMTGSLTAKVEAPAPALITAARKAVEEGGSDPALMRDGDERLLAWARGVLEHMRTRGAIEHRWLKKLIEEDGNRYFIWRGRPRTEGMPAFPIGRTAPAFPRVGPPPTSKRENVLDPVTTLQSWYAQWTARSLHLTSAQAAPMARLLLRHLARAGVLTVSTNSAGAEVYAISADQVLIEPVNDEALVDRWVRLECAACSAVEVGPEEVTSQLLVGPCTRSRCSGRFSRAPGDPANFYRRFYLSREAQRVIAREHTSLLDDKLRTEYEDGFRNRTDRPGAPNVLVATPTLEMGIDIGELSTVMLASLPRSVASYLQRVGRAGRRTGSALDLAFVSGRQDQLPQLAEPLSMINGAVRPPSTYVDAEELLRRQYVAALADVEARKADGEHPTRARDALGSFASDSYLYAIAERGEEPSQVTTFLEGFPTLGESAREELRRWATPTAGPLTSPLAERLRDATRRWAHQLELLNYRTREIEKALPELRAVAERETASDDDVHAHRSAEGSLRLARGQRAELEGKHWIAALERDGVFPNYTLHDDAVTLEVGLSWMDPDTGQYESDTYDVGRNASLALREFAPGATFYSRGYRVKINAVDLGNRGAALRNWSLCAVCGFGADITESKAPSTCPRCASPTIADVSQKLPIVELTRVSSNMRRDEAVIDDSGENRDRQPFEILTTCDYDPNEVRSQWYVERSGFGAKHVKNLQVRWLNLGRAAGKGADRCIAGQERPAELFRICPECGQVDREANGNSKYDHRPWCSKRDDQAESTVAVALSHQLKTEGLLLRLPLMLEVGSMFALPSFAAALMLGLREHLGGAPDHLALASVVDAGDAEEAEPHAALLLHDLVPGGTGYLAEIATPANLRRVLELAYVAVRGCDCAESDRIACHRCLLPFAPWGSQNSVSRAEAERQLRDVLSGGSGTDADPDKLPAWAITTAPPKDLDPESQLEKKFREVFRQRLQTLGLTVKAYPSAAGDRWSITATGGRRWTLDPQVLVGGCKPDFVLRADDPTIPQVAIFCDGEKYHASSAYNRLADDATKRATLRDMGLLVVALAWSDLEQEPTDPAWFSEEHIGTLMGHGLGLKPRHVELLRKGPLHLLLDWVQSPSPSVLQVIGRAMPFFLAGKARERGRLGEAINLVEAAQAVLGPADSPFTGGEGSPNAWVWQSNSVAVVCRTAGTPDTTEVALLLDDGPHAIEAGITDAWRQWLWLSTLLGARQLGTTITVTSLVTAGSGGEHDQAAFGTGASAELSPAWSAIDAQATAAERDLIAALATASAPVPEYGPEVEGLPLGLTWVDRKVTVDLELDLTDEERAQLTSSGWVVVAPEVETIVTALEEVTPWQS